MINEKIFKQYMAALSEIHNKDLSALLNSIYWETLKPYTDEECERAFKELVFSTKFFPKPADFLELLRGKTEDLGGRAWIKVIEAIRQPGPYKAVQFYDPVIHSIFKFWGGWPCVQEWKDSELKWKQKEFERLYALMARDNNHPEYLPGVHESENAANGYEIKPEVVWIGFDEKVKEIAA
jgi:hypothetical protein